MTVNGWALNHLHGHLGDARRLFALLSHMEIVATRRVFQLAAMFALIGNTFLAARPTKRMKPIQIEQLQLRKNLNRYLIYISNSI